ncbi:multicopper oxidase family protein [Actinokineospora xionganensis]|uniref:Multicopper oxidase domain-containing protein n=1 Tax=Actinokineospora xionganensis TaxID=2684470 RepID=A0ABR7L5T8_9PSEU|nr:multicopper oxidase domain-containing protein [Actinokineospora xionganensis]MBC6448051.1 multicopper oxidase domain-containing protein [Actinokineospora xionganensis]
MSSPQSPRGFASKPALTFALVSVIALLGTLISSSSAPTAKESLPVDVSPVAAAAQAQSGGGEDLGDGTRLAEWRIVDGVKVFALNIAPKQWETKPGVVKAGYAINGLIPGPVIRVNEGDRVRFVVKNDMPEETALHWHGMDLPNDQDGVPMLTQPPIEPGTTYTYEWTAISTGSHWYHSHHHGEQESKGVYGSLEVVPRLGDIPADRDYRIMTGDGALGFVINGKSFPATAPLRARVGERVRFRLIGTGPEMIHPMHLHGGFFELVAQDGKRLPFPQRMDTLLLGVGQTFDIVFVPTKPGKWMLHCHIFSHSETHEGMSGLVSILHVDPAAVALPELGKLPTAAPNLPVPRLPLPALPLPALPALPLVPGVPAPVEPLGGPAPAHAHPQS